MAWPYDPLPIPYFTPGYVDAPDLDTLIAAKLNSLRAAVPFGYLAEATSQSLVTLSTGSAFAGNGPVTVVLAVQRRVRISVTARYQLGSATLGRMTVQAGYNSGASVVIGSVTTVGVATSAQPSGSGAAGSDSANSEGTVLLPAGTYTFYPVVTRVNGGATSDSAGSFYTSVHDVGGS